MKLTITREQLQEGLVAVAASVPAKTTLPILSNILLEATKDGIRLSGTDLDISVSTTVPASGALEASTPAEAQTKPCLVSAMSRGGRSRTMRAVSPRITSVWRGSRSPEISRA